ncbi:anthranilate synthase component II [Sphingomicrobium nitratireducens]|uniref:anthranilate synthase component II n=1 Tax=Sphingomicrobium nitratireducens TaxID=2964666 RepID=UPI002240A673|nr:aminodeoxychorismate/anthranilate synthase component II [Sphingomicrobium nitratireducens]
MRAPAILVVDNFDSFTFTLVDYLKSLGAPVTTVRADGLSVADALASNADGILVSPGPGTPGDAGISVPLAAACVAARRPYLGVCLGHQALALACGGTVARVAPVHGKIASVRHDASGLLAGLPSPFDATRYHSLAVTCVAPPLLANAWNEEGLVMAMRHQGAPAHGVQFHPESVASEHGHALLRAFLEECVRETT